MPRTIDSILAAHDVATQRRKEGRPIWDRKLISRRIDDAPFETNRDLFATALESSEWLSSEGEASELWDLWDEIKDSEDVDHFDRVLDAIYDLADEQRVWLQFTHA